MSSGMKSSSINDMSEVAGSSSNFHKVRTTDDRPLSNTTLYNVHSKCDRLT